MPKSKGVSAPFFFARLISSRLSEALLAQATEDFREGRFADALVRAESLCRIFTNEPAPAVLRAKLLEACRPTLAPRAWMDAWARDPLNPVLQDAMVAQWLRAGAQRNAAERAMNFLPERCRQGTHASLLQLLAQAGVQRAGACWRDGDAIEVRCFAPADDAATLRVIVASGETQQVHEVAKDLPARITPPAGGVYSVAFENGRLLQGSPVSFESPHPVTHTGAIEPGVDIIIPVYRDAAGVRACVSSVLESLPANRTPAHLIVVNDASVETDLILWLESLAASGRIELLHNPFNLGFIESVNRALKGRRRNALMLNADTLVHADWIDRLATALAASPDIASVMPWSNNAEVGSLAPRSVDAPCSADDLARIDAAAKQLHASGRTVDMDVPTNIGFAMLMRREVLDRIGLLDGEALTRGYLEEVDWCLRARDAGWRVRLATGVFVAHKGSASFGPEKQLRVRQNRAVLYSRYPRYRSEYMEFLRADPLRDARRQLLDAVAGTGSTWPGRGDAAIARIDRRASLPRTRRRIAVWGLRAGSAEETHVVALARRLASARDADVRLLVFGDASGALLHTGVVDVIKPAAPTDAVLPDAVLASLAGCEELLLADDALTPPEGIPCSPADESFALAA